MNLRIRILELGASILTAFDSQPSQKSLVRFTQGSIWWALNFSRGWTRRTSNISLHSYWQSNTATLSHSLLRTEMWDHQYKDRQYWARLVQLLLATHDYKWMIRRTSLDISTAVDFPPTSNSNVRMNPSNPGLLRKNERIWNEQLNRDGTQLPVCLSTHREKSGFRHRGVM